MPLSIVESRKLEKSIESLRGFTRTRKWERLNRKNRLEERGTMYVSAVLKQKIKAGVQLRSNEMTKDANCFNELTKNWFMQRSIEKNEPTAFWSRIWST